MAQERSKSPILKDAIELVVGAVEALVPNRNALHGAFYEAEKAAIASLGGSAPTNQNAASLQNQEAILKICDELKTCLFQQQEEINALKSAQAGPTYPAQANAHRPAQRSPSSADGTQGSSNKMPSVLSWAPTNFKPHPDNTPVEPWVAVERKRKNRNKNPERVPRAADGKTSRKRGRPPPPDAIAVKPNEGETFADILRSVRKDVDVEKTGAHITSIAESSKGEVLIRVTRGESKRSDLESAIRNALGTRASVRGLVRHDNLDITRLDGVTTEAEITEALKDAAALPPNDDSVRIRNVRPAPGGTRRATVSMRSVDAIKIAKAGRVKIGLVWATVRLLEKPTRCFRCLGFGHTRSKCTGADRTEACSRCSKAGHRAADCSNPPMCISCADLGAPVDDFP